MVALKIPFSSRYLIKFDLAKQINGDFLDKPNIDAGRPWLTASRTGGKAWAHTETHEHLKNIAF